MRVLVIPLLVGGCDLADGVPLTNVPASSLTGECRNLFDDTVYQCDDENGSYSYQLAGWGSSGSCRDIEVGDQCEATSGDWVTCAAAERSQVEADPCGWETTPDACAALATDCDLHVGVMDPGTPPE